MEVSDVSIIVPFELACRTCMGFVKSPSTTQLFSKTITDPDLARKLVFLTGLQVSTNDGLPCQLCPQCVSKLDDAVNFKRQCENSDSLYRQYTSEKIAENLSNDDYIKEEMATEIQYDITTLEITGDYDDFLIFKTEPELQLNEVNPAVKLVNVKDGIDTSKKKGKNYLCEICKKSCNGASSLKRHMSVHKSDRFKCNRCTRIFSRREHLKKHLFRIHSIKETPVKYNCQYCTIDTPNKALMRMHLKSCHKEKLPRRKNSILNLQDCVNAAISSDYDSDKDSKTIGLVAASGGGAIATIKEKPFMSNGESQLVIEVRYKCIICKTEYDNQHSYAAHMTKHSGPIPKGQTDFRCDKCTKVFSKRKNLRQHILTHSEVKANKCTLCYRWVLHFGNPQTPTVIHSCLSFTLSRIKSRQIQILANFKPSHSSFSRPDQLILHMNNHTGKKRHPCPHCDKGFNMLSTLKDHLRTHSGEKPYLCSICGKGFTQSTNLKQHLMRHSSTKPYSCPACHSTFVSKGELDAHMRKHTGDHPFVCDVCGTGFTTSSSLVKHKRIHTGERPYACDRCPLRFTALGTMKNHRRTHTGEKPFPCTFCTKAFAQKSDLVSHTRTHTGERPYVCASCGADYQQSSALKAHIKNRHNSLVTELTRNTNIQQHHQLTIDGEKKLCVPFEIAIADDSQNSSYVQTMD